MKIYKHTGKGMYIGSCIIIIALDRNSAEKLIRFELDSCGLKDEPLNIEEIEISTLKVIHKDNGDY